MNKHHHHILTLLLIGLLIACLLPPIYMYWDAYVTPKWYAAGFMALLVLIYLFYYSGKVTKDEIRECVCFSSLVAIFFEYACILVDVFLHGYASLTVGSCGSFENPGSMAVTVCLLIPSAFLFLRSKYSYLCWILPLFTLIVILLAKSRTGLLAMVVMIVLYVLRDNRIPRKVGWLSAIILLIVTFAYVAYHKTDSSRGRWFIAQRSWDLIEERPFLGHGHGGFLREYMGHQGRYFTQHPDDIAAPLADEIRHPLNEFLLMGVDYGVLGMVLLATLFIVPLILLPEHSVSRWTLPPLIVFSCFSYPFVNPLPWFVIIYAWSELSNAKFRKSVVVVGFMFFFGSVSEKFLQDTGLLRSPYRLYNQAYRHYRKGHLTQAHLEAMECRKMCSGYNLELLTGDIERHLGQASSAICHYETALTMCPSHFAPLQGLYLTYSALGDSINLHRIVQRIHQKPVKVMSPVVIEIKSLR